MLEQNNMRTNSGTTKRIGTTEQNRTEQKRTEQRTEQNRTEQNRTEQNRTEQTSDTTMFDRIYNTTPSRTLVNSLIHPLVQQNHYNPQKETSKHTNNKRTPVNKRKIKRTSANKLKRVFQKISSI